MACFSTLPVFHYIDHGEYISNITYEQFIHMRHSTGICRWDMVVGVCLRVN
jgi:hypothetical protein